MSLPVALQLYTVRDEMEKDFLGTLGKVAGLGYEGVEFAGFGGIPASRLRSTLDSLGLAAVSSHTGMDILRAKLDEAIEYNLEIGSRYIVCPWIKFDTPDEFLDTAEFFDRVGEKCRESGIRFGYHNHDFEFVKSDGKYALDLLFSRTRPENLFAELDTCWVFYAGEDPAAYVRKYSGRCPLIHVKDLKSRDERVFTEVGSGVVDIAGIVKSAAAAGSEWLIVEQDQTEIPSLDSARISLENLKRIQKA